MKLIIMRHAQSTHNRDKLYQGQFDCDLSEKGIRDLEELKHCFNFKFDYCYCSPLKRTRLTAEAVAKKGKIIFDERLKEIRLGTWENTPITDEKINARKKGFLPDGAETRKELHERVKEFFEDIRKKHGGSETILIVSHGGTIGAMRKVLSFEFEGNFGNLNILEIQLNENSVFIDYKDKEQAEHKFL